MMPSRHAVCPTGSSDSKERRRNQSTYIRATSAFNLKIVTLLIAPIQSWYIVLASPAYPIPKFYLQLFKVDRENDCRLPIPISSTEARDAIDTALEEVSKQLRELNRYV